MSPSPAPCSQSRTRSKFVRIWTALDQENSPSGKEEKEECVDVDIYDATEVKLEITDTIINLNEAVE